jgi:hypothetical protein
MQRRRGEQVLKRGEARRRECCKRTGGGETERVSFFFESAARRSSLVEILVTGICRSVMNIDCLGPGACMLVAQAGRIEQA